MNWDVCHWNSCIACTPQGCFAGKSSFLEFLGGTDSLAKFPAHDGLSSQWAKSGNALCLLSRTTVECTTLEPVKKLDTQDDSPTWESHSFPAIGSLPKTNPQCIRCKLTSIYVSNTGNSGPVDVQISFVIEASGQVNDVAIQGSLPDDVISQVRSEVRSWFFEPLLKEGVPTSTVLGMHGRVLVMNPDKPPSPPPQGSLPPD
jgi:hypothetical protein